ncbi:hypothetical protein EDE12_10868 [Methylosinus sp. sav-2]|uniref:hypothetical protein n=1 Tax=Methylosinus sp. sav-2 TaxID=2485168 RepID=UPI001065B2A7|nr:hypothetical protein [Methylosinus sp. sav-2]TDX63160.1 hypothetical protein EDE12_10868 [Methylosinus sp. sav-2]
MWRFFTTLGLVAVWGVLGLQQGVGAPQSRKPIALGAAASAEPLVWQPPAEIADKALAKDEVTGSVGYERSDVHGSASIDAAAFEKLRTEVSALRRAIDTISTHENQSSEHAATFGGVVKAIRGVEKRLAVLEARRSSRSTVAGSSVPRP